MYTSYSTLQRKMCIRDRSNAVRAGDHSGPGVQKQRQRAFIRGPQHLSLIHISPPFVNGSGTLLGNLGDLIKWENLSREKALPGRDVYKRQGIGDA